MEEKIRILCVDDENNVLKALERSLLAEDCEVLTASSGHEGLLILRTVSPVQVVISDYRMPGMSGVEFLRQVCRDWPDTIRIVLSAYADGESIISSVNEGHIYRFITKPWDNVELKTAISNALELYFLNRKNIRITNELLFKIEELKQANFQFECLKAGEKASLRKAPPGMSDKILDSLPAGVVAIDHEGSVILCNREARTLFEFRGEAYDGAGGKTVLPRTISDFIGQPHGQKPVTGKVRLNGSTVRITAVFSRDPAKPAVVLMIERDCIED